MTRRRGNRGFSKKPGGSRNKAAALVSSPLAGGEVNDERHTETDALR
ncbi:MAG: hypothetical protein GY774_13750 [Planctomycetes bacterium]|nr:hypothetical protein [Planctomycetota bacterium]